MSYRPRILIVDDEPELSTSLKGCLGYKNYEIATANNGEQAVELFNNYDFDLVLLDVVMPEMSGYQVMNYIHEKKPEIPVVLMTAYAPVDFTKEDLPEGAHSYLIKPFDLEELVTAVQSALNKG